MTVRWTDHLIIAPILLPLAASALMLLFDEGRRTAKAGISLVTALAMLVISVLLLAGVLSADEGGREATRAYLLGNWAAPFGIVLVIDWLSALMLVLTNLLGFAALVYSLAGWDRAGPRFHALFLLQLMGLNGAFLTGDLFNLFVFFEVLLAASYGLLLHGSGPLRVKAGLHYVAINVATSLLFLIGAGLIYGATGTLNMADLAMRIPRVPAGDIALLQSGVAILGIAFLVKAGMWPLGLWLPRTYAAAAPPAAAIFAILSKVGVYAVLRVYLLVFGHGQDWTTSFGEEWLLYGGMATMAFGTIGVLAARTLSRVAGYCVLISTGTVLATIGVGEGAVLGGTLFYLVSSSLGLAAFYLMIELVERREAGTADGQAGEPVFDDEYTGALTQEPEQEIGIVIPATIAILGGGFILCVLLLSGLPPMSGFIAKFALIDGLLHLGEQLSARFGWLIALLVLSGLATLIAATRAGIDLIWAPSDRPQPVLRLAEALPIGVLLAAALGLVVFAGPAMRYMERTGESLGDRRAYVESVLGAPSASVAPAAPAVPAAGARP